MSQKLSEWKRKKQVFWKNLNKEQKSDVIQSIAFFVISVIFAIPFAILGVSSNSAIEIFLSIISGVATAIFLGLCVLYYAFYLETRIRKLEEQHREPIDLS